MDGSYRSNGGLQEEERYVLEKIETFPFCCNMIQTIPHPANGN